MKRTKSRQIRHLPSLSGGGLVPPRQAAEKRSRGSSPGRRALQPSWPPHEAGALPEPGDRRPPPSPRCRPGRRGGEPADSSRGPSPGVPAAGYPSPPTPQPPNGAPRSAGGGPPPSRPTSVRPPSRGGCRRESATPLPRRHEAPTPRRRLRGWGRGRLRRSSV